ncbi:MAG: hypothetical protein HYU99_08180 [Deltaproteobacteria bacterium]|nr:hypothetical protein [Deltaproteobacteria bacterium]
MSKPRRLFFDTCYYIDLFHGHIPDPEKLIPGSPCLVIGNSIVLMELYQGVRTEREKKAVQDIERSLTLIGPSIQNYLDAGQHLRIMTDKKWLIPKRLYEMQNDILLALSAVDHDSWVVTRNKKDFDKIKNLVPVNVIYYD